MLSNFRKVEDFNLSFGVEVYNTPQPHLLYTNTKLIDYRLKLILEEVNELKDAVETKNFTEVIDALSDILYVVYGFGCSIGVDLDTTFDIVHKSNMSKMCKNMQEVVDTIHYYKHNPHLGYDSPTFRSSKNGYVVFNESTKKVLKNINYTPANFNEYLHNSNTADLVFVCGKDYDKPSVGYKYTIKLENVIVKTNVEYKHSNPDGWTIIYLDEGGFNFKAQHPEFGNISGNFNNQVYATDKLCYLHFMKYHKPIQVL
jgi:predicted HAD superfamily Cof-like phosphohydrolase